MKHNKDLLSILLNALHAFTVNSCMTRNKRVK